MRERLQIYDQIDGVRAYQTVRHTFPTGLPMASVGMTNSGAGYIDMFVTGCIIDASALPARAVPQGRLPRRG